MQKGSQAHEPWNIYGNRDENETEESRGPYLRSSTPFIMAVNGTINGEAFTVEGRGTGNSLTGSVRGKWVCTSGRLPIAWAALAPTLGYNGAKAYVNYPNGITHFFQECLPEGFSQERVSRFQNDGTMKSYHEITYNKGVIMNKVTVQGEGFKKDSPVTNHGIKVCNPLTECVYPFENGVRSMSHHVYPLKGTTNSFIVAEQMTVNRPLGTTTDRTVRQPRYHLIRSECKQTTDVDDDNDHVIQEEVAQAFDLKLFCPFRNCTSFNLNAF